MLTVIASFLLLVGLVGMLSTVGWILRQGNSNSMTRMFVSCQLAIVLWIVSQLLILFSVTQKQLTISYLIGNAGICAFAPCWLLFSLEFGRFGFRGSESRNKAAVLSLGALMFVFIAANPVHHLYYKSFGTDGIEYGVLFYIFQFIFYTLILSGIFIILRRSRQCSPDSGVQTRKQTTLLVLAAAVPLIANTFTLTGLVSSQIELTPLFFAFSVIMILIAIRRFGLLNINRIAIRDTIDNISSAVVVFDSENSMTYCNDSARRLFPVSDMPGIAEFCKRISAEESADSADISFNGRNYSFSRSRCMNGEGSCIAQTIVISDVSEYYELAAAEKKLSLEQERNRIAQEIHDSAGHTFTMISSLAKIICAESDISRIREYAAEIDGQSRGGVTQLRCSINNLRDDSFMTSITRAIKTVTDAVRNIEIETCIQGTEDERYAFCIREIYDTVKESVTNSMRYSGAERIDIIVKFLPERLELYIFDNGKGCAEINEHGGLGGIRRRIEELGGTVRFSSIEGEGFNTIIKLNIENQQ